MLKTILKYKFLILIFCITFTVFANGQVSNPIKDYENVLEWIEKNYYQGLPEIIDSSVNVNSIELYNIPIVSFDTIQIKKENPQRHFQLRILQLTKEYNLTLYISSDGYRDCQDGNFDFSFQDNVSYIGISKNGKIPSEYLEVELNPYSSEIYGTDEVTFDLFYLKNKEIPIICIVTNHPAYVPAHTFYFNEKKNELKYYKTIEGN